ncbi:ABC transporter ATP-binding protein, partial [Aeromonas sp. HMWF014]
RLDKPLRAAFKTLVFERLKAKGIPAILVTHDEEDAPGTILDLTPSLCLLTEDPDLV